MTWRALRLVCACGVLALSVAPACGGNASNSGPGMGTHAGSDGAGARAGAGNSGGAPSGRAGTPGNAGAPATPPSVSCGRASCSGLMISVPVSFTVSGCCSDAKLSQCGLDTSALATTVGAMFPQPCQPLGQPGIADVSCPVSPAVPVQGTGFDIHFPGCCRPDHTCGFQLDGIPGILEIGLGCVDSTPLLNNGGTAQACGEAGAPGSGGSGSLAGAGRDGSDAGAGGDASALAGGASDAAGAGG